jgi:hypothetical protein
VGNQDSEDHSYDIAWEEGKQYWYDIVYEDAKDRRNAARQIRMVDYGGRVDTSVVPNWATAQEIAVSWRNLLEVQLGRGVEVKTGNREEYFWGYRTAAETIPCTIQAENFRGDSCVFPGTVDQFSPYLCSDEWIVRSQ